MPPTTRSDPLDPSSSIGRTPMPRARAFYNDNRPVNGSFTRNAKLSLLEPEISTGMDEKEFADDVEQISSSQRYGFLPALLQGPSSPLASLRRSISEYGLQARKRRSSLPLQGRLKSLELETKGTVLCEKSTLELSGTEKFARHGCDLLNTAVTEAKFSDPQSQAFSRQLYVNATSYILQGLPQDLSEEETAHIRAALPESIEEESSILYGKSCYHRPSILRRSVSSAVLAFCLFLRLTLPYVRYLIGLAYNYEKTHHVAEKSLAAGMSTADSLGKKSIELAEVFVNNRLIMDTLTYCVEGIYGGLNDGLGHGIRVIEARQES